MLLPLGNTRETLDELETNAIVLIEASHLKNIKIYKKDWVWLYYERNVYCIKYFTCLAPYQLLIRLESIHTFLPMNIV